MALNQQGAGRAQIAAALKSLRERAIIGFGDPNLTGVGFDLDPVTKAQTQANYDSGNATLARLSHSNDLSRTAIINSLASSGLLHSGDLGYRQQEQGRAYGNQIYDARQQLIDYLTRGAQDALDRQNALGMAVTNAYQGAYANGDTSGYGGSSGGGQYGTLETPFIPAGYSGDQTAQAANAYAAAHGYTPHMVMQEGTITYQNGQPGVMIKYIDGQGLSTTEWTPLPAQQTSQPQVGAPSSFQPPPTQAIATNPALASALNFSGWGRI